MAVVGGGFEVMKEWIGGSGWQDGGFQAVDASE